MITVILLAIILFLAGVLSFILYTMQYEHDRKMQERQKRKSEAWKTVFQRTDLKA